MTNEQVRKALKLRHRIQQECRTNLLKLCAVLGYADVNEKVHGPILDILQKFKGGTHTEVSPLVYRYTPAVPLWQLEGNRRTLILYPRGHLKTTIITIAHTIQWIINYPDIRVLLSMATGDQAEKVMRELKGHFQYNENFRSVFPEFCPPADRVSDFGSRDEFIVPNRQLVRKEPTVWTCTVGKTIAGVHPDVIKNSDLVDKENVKTPGGINDVISHFRFLNPLLERYDARDGFPSSTGWNDVEGTKYDFGDLHSTLEKSPDWNKLVMGAHNSDYSKILWPSRFSKESLQATQREMGDWEYSAQYLNKCIPTGDGLCDPKDVVFIPSQVLRSLLPSLRLHVTVDLAGMESTRKGDWTVIMVGGFDSNGRLYVIEIHCGHYSPEEVINLIFSIHARYPNVIDYKVEKDAHARVLLPFLQREMSVRQRYPCIYPIKRDTHQSKQHRIRGLRPWFKTGIVRFNDDIPLATKQELLEEVTQFPSESSGVHDDILDTLADQMQNQEGDGVNYDVIANPPQDVQSQFGRARGIDRFMGFSETGAAQWLYGGDPEATKQLYPTGIM